MSNPCGDLDLGGDISCVAVLQGLYDAYVRVLSGGRARVRMGSRWSEYHPGHHEPLKTLYMQIYVQCNDPAKAALPDLSVSTIQRGPPVGGRYPAPYGPVAGRRFWRGW